MTEQPLRLLRAGTSRQLVCFHHAGGMAEYFLPWRDGVAQESALYATQLPGHGARMNETPLTCLHQMADRLAAACHLLPRRPTFFFGHSMGAALAFEVALRLQKQGRPVDGLAVSGRLPPHRNSGSDYYRQSDSRLLEKVTRLSGDEMPSGQASELLTLLMPVFRADFQAIETYQRRCAEKLSCPVFAAVGERDSEVSVEEMSQWERVTGHRFNLKVFSGGHFYLQHQRSALLAFLNRECGRASGASVKEYHEI